MLPGKPNFFSLKSVSVFGPNFKIECFTSVIDNAVAAINPLFLLILVNIRCGRRSLVLISLIAHVL